MMRIVIPILFVLAILFAWAVFNAVEKHRKRRAMEIVHKHDLNAEKVRTLYNLYSKNQKI